MKKNTNLYQRYLDRILKIIGTVQRLESQLILFSEQPQRAFTLLYDHNDFPIMVITRPIDGMDSKNLEIYQKTIKKSHKSESFKTDEKGIDLALHRLDLKKKSLLKIIQTSI